MKDLYLFDVSGLVYAGDYLQPRKSKEISERLSGLPVGGVKHAISKILGNNKEENHLVAVFDSHTDKKIDHPEYKGQRTFRPDIFVQQEMLKQILPALGVATVCVDGYEADDLFYSIVEDELQNNKYGFVYLCTDDSDISGAIRAPRIARMGITAKMPFITQSNYSTLVKSGKVIQYNTVLAYHMFCGKPSNNIHALPGGGAKLYRDYCEFCTSNNIKPDLQSTELAMKCWVKDAFERKVIDIDTVKTIVSRMPIIYPNILKEVPDYHTAKVDAKRASEYLSIIYEPQAAAMLNVPMIDLNVLGRTRLDSWVSLFRSGAVAADNGVPADTSFFMENKPEGSVGGF